MKFVRKVIGLVSAGMVALSGSSASRSIGENDRPKVGSGIYDVQLKTLNMKDNIDLNAFKGKYMLFVNVASKCGYTPQYEGLQSLYEAKKDKLMIIGLPCNQFGLQEPGDSTEIATFCQVNYGVTFPISEKLDVKGSNQHPIYQWLTQKKFNGKDDYTVNWNFNKFLVSPEGELIAYFGSKVKPMSTELTSLIK